MTRDRLIEEATDVIWAERTKGGYRAAIHMEAMLAELRRLWAVEDELERLRRSTELREMMRQDVADVRKLMRGDGA